MSLIKADRTAGRRNICIAVQILFVLAVLFIACNQPYCHDDWAWGLPDRVKMLKKWFAGYNGRYLGNILIMLITRSSAAKVLIPTVFMFWLLRAAKNCGMGGTDSVNGIGRTGEAGGASGKFGLLLLLETIFLLTAVPTGLYAQSYGWLAAFVNFLPPAVLFLVWFHHSEWIYKEEGAAPDGSGSIFAAIAYLLCGMASQLFAENCTLFIAMYAVWTVLLPLIRRRKLPLTHITYAAGCIIGGVMMYANPVYRSGLTTKNSFKSITLSVSSLYYQLRDEMLNDLFLNNVLLNVLLALAAAVLITCHCRHRLVKYLTLPVICGYAFYLIWNHLHAGWALTDNVGRFHTMQLFLCALFVISLLIGVIDSIDSSERWIICVLYVSSLACAAPLMAATPIGTRCFYFTYAVQCVTLVRLTAYLLEVHGAGWSFEGIRSAEIGACTLVLCLAVVYGHIFFEIGKVDRSRTQIIQNAIETQQKEITLPSLPYAAFTWKTEPETDTWRSYFRQFYGLPKKTKITFE